MNFSKDSQIFNLMNFYLSIISVLYASYWDIFMDWGFDRTEMRNYLGTVGSFMVCLLNLVLRLVNSGPLESKIIASLGNIYLLSSLEILRRSIWTDIRIKKYSSQQDL